MPHFEIYAADLDAAEAFYSGLFGWSFAKMSIADGIDYRLIVGDDFSDGSVAGLTGGLQQRPDTPHSAGSAVRGGTMTFDVKDCDERYAWALANGGGEALPPTDFPSVGRCAYVEDGQGNIVGMISPEGAA